MNIKKLIDKFFEWGILIKALVGSFELLTGIFIAVSGHLLVDNFLINVAQQEILEDPNDFIANLVVNSVNNFSAGSYLFAVIYLIFHGVVNIFLAISLAKKKIKTYPAIMAVFGIFMIYQMYRYFHTYSLVLLLLTAFDIFFVSVIWLEYKKIKSIDL